MFIDPFAENWLDWLDKVQTTLPTEEHLYLLLDGAFAPGLHRLMRPVLPQEATLLFEVLSHCSKEASDVSPFVFPYVAGNAGLRRVLERCNGLPMVSAIATSETIEDLAQRLAAWCIVKADGQGFNFRFPDTRRLPGIFNVLTPEQRAELAGHASAWHYIDRDGRWNSLPVPRVQHPAPEAPKLDADQYAAIIADCEPDEVLLLLKDRGRTWHQPHARLHDLACSALRMADSENLEPNLRLDWCDTYIATTVLSGAEPTVAHLLDWKTQMLA